MQYILIFGNVTFVAVAIEPLSGLVAVVIVARNQLREKLVSLMFINAEQEIVGE